jgi:hypothetical protein
MTRQEFIQAQKRNSHGVVLPAFLCLAVMVALPIAWYWVQVAEPELGLVWTLAGHGICLSAFVVGGWFVYVRLSHVEQRNQHWCPQCKEGFGGTEEVVLETLKCHHCGARVIDDE